MLVVNRFRVGGDAEGEQDAERAAAFARDVLEAHEVLAARPGYVTGHVGRNVDEPDLWTLVTLWESVGTYRRALSATEVKMRVHPLLYRALDEPSAYELVGPGADLNVPEPRSLP
ncbi:antibiotic biosynthesis monooxygenase family protein [Nocardioides sp. GY 10127]|uniref:antibiotic biosynthesis monooxygenase family protein n=1 Tax=Nocardioides sp. GY 10127 TaxID=2569762 RepID=UPI0010A8DBF8|nr:antibiotic biosynthesis monooxygenase family protein [Nocardioides sp. GY 10127]TIC83959.1 antibiotic biosynthesis monooxygenase [Nocardioides sp. GY 10127]